MRSWLPIVGGLEVGEVVNEQIWSRWFGGGLVVPDGFRWWSSTVNLDPYELRENDIIWWGKLGG